MRKRLRDDWPVVVYKYRAYVHLEDLPDAIFDHMAWKNAVWNQLVDLLNEALEEWPAVKKTEDQKQAGTFWDEFRRGAALIVETSPLNWEAGPDLLDRFMTAVREGFRGAERGFPRKRYGVDRVNVMHRYTGGGLPAENLFGSRARRFAIYKAPPEGAYADNARRSRRQRVVDARFGVDGETFDFRLRLHRPLPEGAILKRVAFLGERTRHPNPDKRWIWHVAMTVEVPPGPVAAQPARRIAGLDLGWRKFDDYLRVGYLYDGRHEIELRLPLDTSSYRTRRDDLPSTWSDKYALDARIAKRLDEVKAEVKKILDEVALPKNVKASLAQIQKMRDGGLRRLARSLAELEGTAYWSTDVESAHCLLVDWAAENENHRHWAGRLGERLVRRREWIYGNLAAWLCRNWDIIGWEGELDIKQMAEAAEEPAIKAAQRYRQIAAIGDLRRRMRENAVKHSMVLLDCETAGTTHWCSVEGCGALVETGPALMLQCSRGHVMDQDSNAARNLYQATISQITGDLEQPAGLRKNDGYYNEGELQIPSELEGVAVIVRSG